MEIIESKIIPGVKIINLKRFPDNRGFFSEIFRESKVSDSFKFPAQASYTETYPGLIKAFHYHTSQTDYWICLKGNIQVALMDSWCSDLKTETIFMGENNPKAIIIPPMVAHGYKVLGNEKIGLLYLTDREYNSQKPDECRLPAHGNFYDWSCEDR